MLRTRLLLALLLFIAGARDVSAAITQRSDGLVLCSSGDTFTLPTAANKPGRIYRVKNTGTSNCTVATTGGQTIDGQATWTVVPGLQAAFTSDAGNWISSQSTTQSAAVSASVLLFGATPGGSVDAHLQIQAAIDAIEASGHGGTLVIPKGYVFKISQPLRISKSNITVTGGGEILMDSASWTAVPLAGYSSVACGFVVWNGVSQRRYVSPLVPYDPTYNSELTENVVFQDITFRDTGTYTSGFVEDKNAICFYGVRNSKIIGNRFFGIKAEVLQGDIAWKNVEVAGNYFEECSHNGIAPVVTDKCEFHHNVFRRVYQPFETSLTRSSIHHNVIHESGNGVGSAIWVGTGSLTLGLDGSITDNIISGASTTAAVILARNDTATSAIYNLKISGNVVTGRPIGSGANLVRVYAPNGAICAPYGVVDISNNTIREDDAAAANWGNAIYVDSVTAAPATSRVSIKNNIVSHVTGYAYSSVAFGTGTQLAEVIGNTFQTSTALRWGAAGVDGVISFGATSARNNCQIRGNYLNGKLIEMLATSDTTTDATLATLGKQMAELTPGTARTITEIAHNVGSIVYVRATNGNVTINEGTYIHTSTGANLTLTAGVLYPFMIWQYTGGHYYARALGSF